mmetsp:Transcript_37117/g.59782  ORF Transcript_37117/g.59782 Transcript_37117/m.59782 type:complete len:178 (-) Transcript_37117:40-573(-)|eukprot:CAMPEP_0115087598 /NCGR_PEP_ID=MMETSP0227-20121206/23408_1 /TAXON_ID=89957 /ORGANISM="Polarella glacialis, Strain CCMP 1383" /LENGTH=177 /DNA_ID=CAMNT_0002477541 /DNA_START=67 /DNA_END=600 /DNA_ORIENTATION=+
MSSSNAADVSQIPPLPGLSRCASEPLGSFKSAKPDIRRLAAENVALGSLYAHSGTGTLQHENLPRIRRVLEKTDDSERGDIGLRDKAWTRHCIQAEKAAAKTMPPDQPGPRWRLSRGLWYYDGGETEKLSADEAMAKFIAEEEARGRGPRYRNSISVPGLGRRFNKRNPYGGFFVEL